MAGGDETRPTSALSAMINARSLQQLHPAGSGPSHPTTTTPTPTTSSSTVYRPADLQPSDADPTRRRNLVVSGTAASASSMAAPSYKRQGPFSNSGSAYSNYVTAGSYGNGFPGARILAPESSPGPATAGAARSAGGWMTAEDELGGPVPAKRSPYFAPIELSRNGGGSSSGVGVVDSRSSSDEDDSPRPRKRLVRSDDVQPTPSSTINVTSPVDHDDADADGEADESLPSVTEAMPPGLVSFRTALKGDDTPSSSVNLKLGKLNVASSGAASSESSRRPTPDIGAETQAVVGPGMMKKGKGKVKPDDSDDEDGSGDKKMADASFIEVGPDASSPPIAVNKKPTKRMVIPESPDTPSAPTSTTTLPTMPTTTKRTLASSSVSPPPRPAANRADPETVVTRLCSIYPSVSRGRMRRIYDQAGGDVRKMTDLLHAAAAAGAGTSNGTGLSTTDGGGGVKIMKKPAVHHPPPSTNKPAAPHSAATRDGNAGGRGEEQKRKLVRKVESEDEDSDDFSGSDEDDEPVVTEEEALHFFNTCAESEMPGITACTLEQAKMVIAMRPFVDADDMIKKLRKKKGVSSAIFDQYRDIMKGFIEVDRVLNKCEKHGSELSEIMRVWTGASTSTTASNPDPDRALTSLTGSSSDAPPALAAADGGVHLVEVSGKAVDEGSSNEAPEHVRKAFEGFLRKQPDAVPDGITLKPYQMLGINWLNLLYRKGISCILADEMGLGKTAQVIAFLANLKSQKSPGPHLIIVPSSTLDNWMREFSVFAPSLSVRAYYGSQAERAELRYELRATEDLDVVVTTYNIATSSVDDRKFVDKMGFRTATYDEGHQLKNSESKKYKDLMRTQIPWRLLLTGTPLQNNLQELVSLLSFILPTIFKAARDDLRAIFKVPSDAQAGLLHQQRITRAKKMMTPFVLRRKKVQVLQDLPKKIERVEYCDMSPVQRLVYREALQRSRKALADPNSAAEAEAALFDEADDEGAGGKGKKGGKQQKTKMTTTKSGTLAKENSSANVLMELRKASNHPMLFRRLYDDKKIRAMAKDCLRELEFHDRNVDYIFEDMEIMTDFELHLFSLQYKALSKHALKKSEWMKAGKIEVLKRLLPELKANGDRVLIFSQFTQVLAILESVLDTMGIRYLLLTGQTPVNERQGLVDEFSTDPDITVFLLSTRAGGLGLNLMAANVVLIHDQDFNPHNDRQAEDRAYRLGQKRDVTVIKLITRGTIEEDIYQLAQTKIKLDAQVSSTGHAQAATTTEDGVELPAGEGNEAATEKAVKLSLMAKLKQRAAEEEEVAGAAEDVAVEDEDPAQEVEQTEP